MPSQNLIMKIYYSIFLDTYCLCKIGIIDAKREMRVNKLREYMRLGFTGMDIPECWTPFQMSGRFKDLFYILLICYTEYFY